MKRLILVAVLLLGAAAVAGVARPEGSHAAGDPPAAQRTITVTGTGTASATPTHASVEFGVQTQSATARAALAANATSMRKVIAALDSAGAEDVATETVSLSAMFGDNQTVQGYTAVNTVSATVTYDAAGATIDAAVEAGANQVYGPSPLADDADAVYQKALADAVADARAHGETLAKAAGGTLGPVVTIAEGGASPVPVFQKTVAGAADSTPVVPGAQETTASVTVTFELA
jgi:uncharacterized protein YggE